MDIALSAAGPEMWPGLRTVVETQHSLDNAV
jgi:hypothetical protein